jgi:outer membrane protein OmpA-like peptidoglycan-associated protein
VGGQAELGALGVYTAFDDTTGLEKELGVGASLGFFLSRVFSLEAGGDYAITRLTGTADEVRVARVGGTLLAHLHAGAGNTFYVGTGFSKVVYRGALDEDDSGPHVVLGDRISLGGRLALRLEGRGSYLLAGAFKELNLSAAAGLSVYAFGGPQRDADHDGIGDKIDRCPGTPQGAAVDGNGCPLDSDEDRVFDGLDACPGTLVGATVDASGCPSDSDIDGVLDGIDACPDTPSGATVDATGCPSDTDSDSVLDGLDRCPATPAGAQIDQDGCPLDDDADGVFNGIDQCPNTPEGVAVDETGCPLDSDGDGVVNALDRCPDTPPNTEVDASGCEVVRDSDGDGVPDAADRCPNTAPDQPVDAAGCPVLFVIEQGQFVTGQGERGPLVLQGVNFEISRSRLTEDSYAILDLVAASLLEYPDVRVEIGGHTDATGTDAINNPLSLARARAVMAYLARKGIPPERLEARGYGSTQPVATNTTAEGRRMNRRVELTVIGGGQ